MIRIPDQVRSACVPPQRIRSSQTKATMPQVRPARTLRTGAISRRMPVAIRDGPASAEPITIRMPVEHDGPADLAEDLGHDQPDVMRRRPVLAAATSELIT